MENNENCSDCPQSHDCKSMYQQLGNAKGPNVVLKVLLAFVVPIAVFIAGLALFGHVFAGLEMNENMRIGLTAILAAGVAFIDVLITRMLTNRMTKNKVTCVGQGD